MDTIDYHLIMIIKLYMIILYFTKNDYPILWVERSTFHNQSPQKSTDGLWWNFSTEWTTRPWGKHQNNRKNAGFFGPPTCQVFLFKKNEKTKVWINSRKFVHVWMIWPLDMGYVSLQVFVWGQLAMSEPWWSKIPDPVVNVKFVMAYGLQFGWCWVWYLKMDLLPNLSQFSWRTFIRLVEGKISKPWFSLTILGVAVGFL